MYFYLLRSIKVLILYSALVKLKASLEDQHSLKGMTGQISVELIMPAQTDAASTRFQITPTAALAKV